MAVLRVLRLRDTCTFVRFECPVQRIADLPGGVRYELVGAVARWWVMTQPPSFARRREDFTCLRCELPVRGNGYTNHCPRCLWSRHVDVNPGDRAAECGGAMEPIGALSEGGGIVVVQRCLVCGHSRRNRGAADDDRDALLALFGRPVPDPPRPPSR